MKPWGFLSLRHWMRLDADEASFEKRGFYSSPARGRLEAIGATFIRGYNLGLESPLEELGDRLSEVDREFRGWAFEGAAMSLTMLDLLTPWRARRLETLLHGAGDPYVYLIHVGAGWALARLKRSPRKLDDRLDPLLRWLAIDGYGFHEGFFSWPRTIGDRRPAPFSGYAARVYDQGLGRSMWFVKGADVEQIAQAIAQFPNERHPDLWSGVGLACAYAGGVSEAAIESVLARAGELRGHVAQGVSFAAKARARPGIHTAATALACRVICRLDIDGAAAITDECLPPSTQRGREDGGDYETWRSSIRGRVTGLRR